MVLVFWLTVYSLCVGDRSGHLFLVSLWTLPWQPIVGEIGKNLHSANWRSKTDCSMTVLIKNVQRQYILRKFEDYDGNNSNFLDNTPKMGISHRISQKVLGHLRQIFSFDKHMC